MIFSSRMKFLCKIGLHKWRRWGDLPEEWNDDTIWKINCPDCYHYCLRCGNMSFEGD